MCIALGLAVDIEEAGGVDALIGHPGVRLSGGQGQRLALARARATEPELPLADDISSALDATTEVQLWDSLRAHRTTVIGATSKRAALASRQSGGPGRRPVTALSDPSPVPAAISGTCAAAYLVLRHATASAATTAAPPTATGALLFASVALVATTLPVRLPWAPLAAPVIALTIYL